MLSTPRTAIPESATPEPGNPKYSLRDTIMPWLVCFAAALFFFYEFIQMNMFNAISGDLMHDFHISGAAFGYLSATYLLGDVVFLLPSGMLLDRYSTRKIIISAMVLCISGTVIFALATSFTMAAIAHFMAGVGNAFSFMSSIMLASRWFPPRRMALVTGLIVTFAMAGGVVAQTPMTLLAGAFGWRHALLLNAALGGVILTIIWLVVRDLPPRQQQQQQTRRKNLASLGFKNSLMQVLKNPQNWLAGSYTSLLNMPIMLMGALWGSLHLIQIDHLSPTHATDVTSMIFIGTIIGAPLLGWLSDFICYRRLPMVIFALLSLTLVAYMMVKVRFDLNQLLILYLALGFITSAQVISYPLIAESNPRMLTGTAMGLASILIMGGGAIAQPLFGWLLNLDWNHLKSHGTPIYSVIDYYHALAILPIAFLVALIAALLLRESRCLSMLPSQEERYA